MPFSLQSDAMLRLFSVVLFIGGISLYYIKGKSSKEKEGI